MKTRRDFIEAEYVDGVYDAKGNQLIRPLTDQEREWLSQFYAETEHGNFVKTREIEAQEQLYKQLQRDYKKNYKSLSFEQASALREELDATYKKLVHLRAETNTFYPEDEDRHEIFTKGNRRKEDVFNLAKNANRLINLDLPEMDQFTSRAEKEISPETMVLDYLARRPAKKVIRKKKLEER